MKILILTQHFPPEPGSASMRMFELSEHLVARGHEVTVVTPFPNYPKGIIYKEYRGKLFMKKNEKGITTIRTFVYASHNRQKFLHGMLYYSSFMFTSILGALTAGKPDIIYVYSPPYFLGISAWIIGKLFHIPFILEVNDLWPKSAVALGVLKNKYLIKIAEWVEKFIYKNAEKIFVYSRQIGQDIIDTGITDKKVEIHSLWTDTNLFQYQSDFNDLRIKHQWNDKFVAMYAGNIGAAQGLEHIIECAHLLKKNGKIIFVIVGDGIKKDALVKKRDGNGLKNVQFIQQQPKEVMPQFLSSADILLVHLNRAPHRLGTIPAKLLDYMSCGRPILAAVEGETANLVEKSKCGLAVESQNPEAMAKAILTLYEDRKLRERLGANARNYAVSCFDKMKLLAELENRLYEVANN